MFDPTFRNVDIFHRRRERKSEHHVNSKKTYSEGEYYITIFGKSSRDNTKDSTRRELNVNKHCTICTLVRSLLLALAELQYFLSPKFLPVQLQTIKKSLVFLMAKVFTEFYNLFYRIQNTFLPNLNLANLANSVKKTNLAERY